MKRIDKLHEMDARQTAELMFETGMEGVIDFCQRLPECCRMNPLEIPKNRCKECLVKWLESEVED